MTAARYDVAVVGAGPAGACAALEAGRHGCRTLLIDEQGQAGGQIWRAKSRAILRAPPTPESQSGDRLRAALENSPVEHRTQARVWHLEKPADGIWRVHLLTSNQLEEIPAKTLILATGARERVLPVEGWTLPGVLGLAGTTALMKEHWMVPGGDTVVAGSGPLVFFVAAEILRLGGRVGAVATLNARREWARALPALARRPQILSRGLAWMRVLRRARTPVYWRHGLRKIAGERRVQGVEIAPVDNTWAWARRALTPAKTLAADSVCLGHGLLPCTDAARLAGAGVAYKPALGGWTPAARADGGTNIAGLWVCGDGAGIRGADAAQAQGRLSALAAVAAVAELAPEKAHALQSRRRALLRELNRAGHLGMALTALSIPRPGWVRTLAPDTILCRCENLTQGEIAAEIEAGAGSANAVKCATRAGMGACGGKYCMDAVTRLIAQKSGLGLAEIPLPTARPPLRPLPLSALAADSDDFHRRLFAALEPAPL